VCLCALCRQLPCKCCCLSYRRPAAVCAVPPPRFAASKMLGQSVCWRHCLHQGRRQLLAGRHMRCCLTFRHAVAAVGPFIFLYGGLVGSTLHSDLLLADDGVMKDSATYDARSPPWMKWLESTNQAASMLAQNAAEEAKAAGSIMMHRASMEATEGNSGEDLAAEAEAAQSEAAQRQLADSQAGSGGEQEEGEQQVRGLSSHRADHAVGKEARQLQCEEWSATCCMSWRVLVLCHVQSLGPALYAPAHAMQCLLGVAPLRLP
jgi:hypothetical protein